MNKICITTFESRLVQDIYQFPYFDQRCFWYYCFNIKEGNYVEGSANYFVVVSITKTRSTIKLLPVYTSRYPKYTEKIILHFIWQKRKLLEVEMIANEKQVRKKWIFWWSKTLIGKYSGFLVIFVDHSFRYLIKRFRLLEVDLHSHIRFAFIIQWHSGFNLIHLGHRKWLREINVST